MLKSTLLKILLKRLNEWSRPDFKFGSFKLRGVVHLVVLLGEVIRMCHLLSLEEVREEPELLGHREEELHLEELKVEGDRDNRGLSPKEFLHPLLVRVVDIVVSQTIPRIIAGEK